MRVKDAITQFFTVWSMASTSTGLFHGLTTEMNSTELHKVRISFEIRNNSGAAKVQGAVRYKSPTATSWDSATAFGPSATTSEGWSFGTSFADLTTGHGTRKLLGQLGVVVVNDSGTDVELARVRIQHDHED